MSIPGTNRNAWVDVQKNTFSKWANNYLAKKNMVVEDLYTDLSDGLLLIALLQIISREKVVPRFNRKPKMRIQKLENLNMAFEYMRKKGLLLTNIGSSDILDGNSKLILGLLWTIICKFQVTGIDVDGVSGKEGLLLWCQRNLIDKKIPMTNFTSCWNNGLAFCGLLHRFHPHLIDYDSLTSENPVENIELAFTTARDQLEIPQLLEVKDIAENPKPDEKSIVTYVSLLFQKFASGMQKKTAVTTITKAVNISIYHEKLKEKYTRESKKLCDWYSEKIVEFESLEQFSSLDRIKQALMDYNEFKKNTKPKKEAEYVALESCAGRWIASCKNNGRGTPMLHPPIKALQDHRNKLERLEIGFESNLRAELERLDIVENVLNRVINNLVKLENWTSEKEFFLHENVQFTNTAEAEAHVENLLFIEDHELSRYQKLYDRTIDASNDMSLDHEQTASTLQRLEVVSSRLKTIGKSLRDCKLRIMSELKKQRELDSVEKDCYIRMRSLYIAMEELGEEMEVPVNTESAVVARNLLDEYATEIYPRFDDVANKYDFLKGQIDLIVKSGRSISFPEGSPDRVAIKVQEFLEQRIRMKNQLEIAVKTAERSDVLCTRFAELASSIKDSCSETSQEINSTEGALEEQLERIKLLYDKRMVSSDIKGNPTIGDSMKQLEEISMELDDLHMFRNPYTSENIQSLRAKYSSLENAFSEKIDSLEKEIVLQRAGNLSPEQLLEIKEVFNHFDVDNDGFLGEDEFLLACQGLGLSLRNEDCHDLFLELDEKDRGEINIHQFSNFCAAQFESGSSIEDVLSAFSIISGSSAITKDQIEEHFEPLVSEYMMDRMYTVRFEDGSSPESEEGGQGVTVPAYDYNFFSNTLFDV